MTFSKKGKTHIRFLKFSEENIRNVVDDEAFAASLTQTYAVIEKIIQEAV